MGEKAVPGPWSLREHQRPRARERNMTVPGDRWSERRAEREGVSRAPGQRGAGGSGWSDMPAATRKAARRRNEEILGLVPGRPLRPLPES